MRPQSRKQIQVRKKIIGGELPLICLPLVAASRQELLDEAAALVALSPDLLEWRIDGFAEVENVTESLAALGELRRTVGDVPLIFTCRIDREGGMRAMSRERRLELILAAIGSGDIDLVDIELCNDQEFIDRVKVQARTKGVALILSYHNFQETPDEDFLVGKLLAAYRAGADIPKLAVMPKNYGDVLTLLSATNRARNGEIDLPLVTMSMGGPGGVTRLAGGLFGSDITFAIGKNASAPGQIPIALLRSGMAVLYDRGQ